MDFIDSNNVKELVKHRRNTRYKPGLSNTWQEWKVWEEPNPNAYFIGIRNELSVALPSFYAWLDPAEQAERPPISSQRYEILWLLFKVLTVPWTLKQFLCKNCENKVSLTIPSWNLTWPTLSVALWWRHVTETSVADEPIELTACRT